MKRLQWISIGVVLGVVLSSVGWALFFESWRSGVYLDARHRRFVEVELPQYDQMAKAILAQSATLTAQAKDFGPLVNRPQGASARTNADGSVTMLFPGGEGGPRHGHIYHSGAVLTDWPPGSGDYVYRLTNNWYEY